MAGQVKLTLAEALALVAELEKAVGYDALAFALVGAIGAERAGKLIADKTGRISKAETVALVKAIIPLVPGENLKAKIKAAIAALRRAIPDKARADAILAYVVQRIKDYKMPPVVAPVVSDGFLRFYGRVNLWAMDETALRNDVQICALCRVGYQIEMAGWRSGETAFDGHLNLAKIVSMYGKLVGWCETAGIPLFVSITNQNIVYSKYGNVGRKFATIVPAAKQLAQAVYDCGGKDFVFVQPVAETNSDDSAATGFEKWCGTLFKGWKLVYNGGSRPSKPAYGWPHFAYHPNSTADGGKRGGISISDTGTIIKQLAADGTLDGPGDPAKIAAWFAKCKASGAIGAGYYAFKRVAHDPDAIRACSAPQAATAPASDTGDIDLSTAVWHGPNGSKAKVTETLSNLKIDSKQISYAISKGTDSWEPHTGAKNVNQYSCFFVFRDGRFQGGKFDWSTYSRKTRSLDNIKTGYTGGIVPRTGEDVWFCFMDLGGTKRTNCEKVKWP